MMLCPQALALAAPLTLFLQFTLVTSSPFEILQGVRDANPIVEKRQDPGPQGPVDPSGIEPEDEDPAQIAADGTEQLRKGDMPNSYRSFESHEADESLKLLTHGLCMLLSQLPLGGKSLLLRMTSRPPSLPSQLVFLGKTISQSQMIKIKSEVLTHGTSIIFLSSKLSVKHSKPIDRRSNPSKNDFVSLIVVN